MTIFAWPGCPLRINAAWPQGGWVGSPLPRSDLKIKVSNLKNLGLDFGRLGVEGFLVVGWAVIKSTKVYTLLRRIPLVPQVRGRDPCTY